MTCCFMNFHEKESAKDLEKHFDQEIDYAIGRGCSAFITGTKYPEDKIFAERVMNIKKFYADGEIELVCMDKDDKTLRNKFIDVADWEIYAYDTDDYPLSNK